MRSRGQLWLGDAQQDGEAEGEVGEEGGEEEEKEEEEESDDEVVEEEYDEGGEGRSSTASGSRQPAALAFGITNVMSATTRATPMSRGT